MIVGGLFPKSVRDRWIGVAVASAAMSLFLLFGMAAYRDIDLSLYTDLPAGIRSLMGIQDEVDAASLAYGAVYSMMGALTLSGLAISIGARSIAGEERSGTIGLLLSNPVSRKRVLGAKMLALVALIAAAAAVMWGAGEVIPPILDAPTEGLSIGALMLHMAVSAVFYGMAAAAIGAGTGKAGVASGATAGLMMVSYLAASLLPLVDGVAGLARLSPWYYFDGGDPLTNGVRWGHLALLGGATVILAALALVWVDRRDLRSRSVGVTLVDRLRADARTRGIVDRLAGSTRVSAPWVMTVSRHQALLTVTAAAVLVLGFIMGPLYSVMDQDLKDLSAQLGDTMTALIGGVDMGTPEGFLQAETFSITVPIAFMAVLGTIGAKALAADGAGRTLSLVLANPISRRRLVAEQVVAMSCCCVVLALVTFLGTWFGVVLGGLSVGAANIAATSIMAALLGLGFGQLALAIGAATGRVAPAAYGAAGTAVGAYLVNAFVPLSDHYAGWKRVSPFYYYLGSEPLANGFPWGHAAVLAASSIVLSVAAMALFERRDLN